jgi:hypothetical protein
LQPERAERLSIATAQRPKDREVERVSLGLHDLARERDEAEHEADRHRDADDGDAVGPPQALCGLGDHL